MKSKLANVGLGLILLSAFLGAESQTGTVPLTAGNPPLGLTDSNITVLNGNVGIGTKIPGALLEVSGAGSTSNGMPSIWVGDGISYNTANDSAINGMLGFRGAGWVNGFITFYPHKTDGHSYFQLTGQSYSYGDSPSGLLVNGPIGIGTSSPKSLFDIQDTSDPILSMGQTTYTAFPDAETAISEIRLYNQRPYIDKFINLKAVVFPGQYMPSFVVATSPVYNANPPDSFVVREDGRVGIGVAAPNQKLEVNGYIQTNAGIYFPGNSTPQTKPYTGVPCGGDYAESVDVTGDRRKYEPGDVLVIDPSSPGKFLKSAKPYSTAVTGIYSTKPGTVGRRQATPQSPEEVPMAMIGIVPTKVSAENGAIHAGDLLVSASIVGYAMKGTDRSKMLGAVIGKALGNLDSGKGVIEVVITLQ